MSLFGFIDVEKAVYPISLLCRVLKVSRSGYYARSRRPPSRRSLEDSALTAKIREVHERSRHTYGYYPHVRAELRSLGVECGRRRAARLMREAGLLGCVRGCRKPSATHPDGRTVVAPDLAWIAAFSPWLPIASGWPT